MVNGIPARQQKKPVPSAGAITAIMTGTGLRATSAEMQLANWEHSVIQRKQTAYAACDAQPPLRSYNSTENYEAFEIKPPGALQADCPDYLLSAARNAWDKAVEMGEKHGYRNAQTTVIAPTGTIGLVMDCDTTGIEPDFALVKFKKLSGGGYFKIINQAVPEALSNLGYSEHVKLIPL